MTELATLNERLANAQFIPAIPVHLFEDEHLDIKARINQFLENCKRVFSGEKKGHIGVGLLEWLENVTRPETGYTLAFFGSSVYSKTGCRITDVDVMAFIGKNESTAAYRLSPYPRKVSLMRFYEHNVPSFGCSQNDFALLVSGPLLLYPSEPHGFALQTIETARNLIGPENSEKPLLARIPYAAAKVLNNQEWEFFESAESARRFAGKILTDNKAFYPLDPGVKPSLTSVNAVYEDQMNSMNDADLSVLTGAALNRLRVRGEHRERLCRAYSEKLREGRRYLIGKNTERLR